MEIYFAEQTLLCHLMQIDSAEIWNRYSFESITFRSPGHQQNLLIADFVVIIKILKRQIYLE